MHVLRWTFKLFIASGYFLPPTLKSPTKRFLYNLYTVFMTLYMWSYSLTLIMEICYNVESQDDLSENFGITVTALITSCKLMSLVIGRKTIINMLDLLKKKPFVPENNGEVQIHAKYDNLIEKVAMFYTIQVTFCVLALVGTTLVSNFKVKKLMFRAWFPFDFTSSWFAFSMTFIYQFVGLMIIATGVSMFDTFFAGLLLHICCQFEMLMDRLHHIGGNEIESLKNCVQHHNTIFRFVTCSLDISNMLYHSDWPNLSNDARKMLVVIMARSLTPVEITSAYILPMNLESFKGVSIYVEIYYLHKRKLKTILGTLSNSPSIWEKRIAICYTILVEVAAIWIFVRAFLTDFKKRKLVFRAWLPYDYSELLPYTFSYAYEVVTSLLCSCQNVASDTLFAGLLIQINGQFEILEERLRNIEEDSNYSAKQCVKHYQQIYKFSKTVNEKFKIILFLQFCTIAFTLCFNLYRMTNITMLSKFLEASLFLVRIIAQILYYCWFSNEVKLKSLQVPAMIFKSNWASWDTKTKKILLVIMTRATHPIEFTSGYLVTLNIDSFVALMKTSYSVFNLLQQTK
ncbi:odorant receptor Or1-like [Bombus impatiens]|uniref:Odorant receptor Or1-like n=1 Tax=Bombus impatiens TaxID=132113 RepID=A0A6P8LB19_BOMIM|nr:odorant receptor Or1-like [Bombus impatiens]